MLFKDCLISAFIDPNEYLNNVLCHMKQCGYECELYFSDKEEYKLKCVTNEIFNETKTIYFGINDDMIMDCNIVEMEFKRAPVCKARTFYLKHTSDLSYGRFKFVKSNECRDEPHFLHSYKYNSDYMEQFFMTKLWVSSLIKFEGMK